MMERDHLVSIGKTVPHIAGLVISFDFYLCCQTCQLGWPCLHHVFQGWPVPGGSERLSSPG